MGCTVQWVKNAVLTKANLYRLLLVIGLYIYCLVGAVSFHAIEGPFEKNTDTAQIEGYKKLLGKDSSHIFSFPRY